MAVKTNKLAETIKSDLAITVGIYSWETSYSLNQAHTSTVHTPHQTRWIQIIWQIFWKFLINQIRIFNFTFCVPSLFFLCVCVLCTLSLAISVFYDVFFSLSAHWRSMFGIPQLSFGWNMLNRQFIVFTTRSFDGLFALPHTFIASAQKNNKRREWDAKKPPNQIGQRAQNHFNRMPFSEVNECTARVRERKIAHNRKIRCIDR